MNDYIRSVVLDEIGRVTGQQDPALESRLEPDLGLDSLGLMEAIVAIEDRIDRRAPEQIVKARTLAEFVEFWSESSSDV